MTESSAIIEPIDVASMSRWSDPVLLKKGKVNTLWLAERLYEVEEAENAKIKKGDTFRCAFMLKGQPMYLDDLHQAGRDEPVNYVAGSKNGLTTVRVIFKEKYTVK